MLNPLLTNFTDNNNDTLKICYIKLPFMYVDPFKVFYKIAYNHMRCATGRGTKKMRYAERLVKYIMYLSTE